MLIALGAFAGLTVVVIVANVFISALLVGVADTVYKRAQAVSTTVTGKAADQRPNTRGG